MHQVCVLLGNHHQLQISSNLYLPISNVWRSPQNPLIIDCLFHMAKCTLFPINHEDFCEMSSNFVVALESYPGMTQKSWRVDEMGIHMTLLLWCNMALFTVCRENKQLRVICGEKNSPGRGISCTGGKKKSGTVFTRNQHLCGAIPSCW